MGAAFFTQKRLLFSMPMSRKERKRQIKQCIEK